MKITHEEKKKALAKFILLSKNERELSLLLSDLLTSNEIDKVYERMEILNCLTKGYSQRKTVNKTGAAIATVSRGSQVVQKQDLQFTKVAKRAEDLPWWRKHFWCA